MALRCIPARLPRVIKETLNNNGISDDDLRKMTRERIFLWYAVAIGVPEDVAKKLFTAQTQIDQSFDSFV